MTSNERISQVGTNLARGRYRHFDATAFVDHVPYALVIETDNGRTSRQSFQSYGACSIAQAGEDKQIGPVKLSLPEA